MNLWLQYFLPALFLMCFGPCHKLPSLVGLALQAPVILPICWMWLNTTCLTSSQVTGHRLWIELGAGSGYWAYLLKQMDVDIIAYDDFSWETAKTRWFPVQNGNENSLLGHQNRALFLCWPPNRTGMATRSLLAYLSMGGKTVIYVGEHPAYLETRSTLGHEPIFKPTGTGMAEPEFFMNLDIFFELVRVVELPNWPRFKDKLFIWKRKTGSSKTN